MDFKLKLLKTLILICTGASAVIEQHRPCFFNPLCTCSHSDPDLGSVKCYNVPLFTLPIRIQTSAIYMMDLKNNGLHMLQDDTFNSTGMWKLVIQENFLTNLSQNALAGVEKSLSILDLSRNKFARIPSHAFRKLKRLQTLILTENQITVIEDDAMAEYGQTLKVLDISGNLLTHVTNKVFKTMESLEVLNLAWNSIKTLSDIFQLRMNNLKSLDLAGNQLQKIPHKILFLLKNIKTINLSHNLITDAEEGDENNSIYLDELNLEYNLLDNLSARIFEGLKVNKLYLEGNPLKQINQTAFLNTNLSELKLSKCMIAEIPADLFQGLTETLQVLDLSYNSLENFDVKTLTKLETLNLKGNKVKIIDHKEFEKLNALKYIDISGENMGPFPNESFLFLPNLRYISYNKINVISKDDFKGIGSKFEELHLTHGSITVIENDAFFYLTHLKKLDLSYNNIKSISSTAFKAIGHSLEELVLHKALSTSVLPLSPLSYLSQLQKLDLSCNNINSLPSESFLTLKNLKYINLNHNNIKNLNIAYLNGRSNANLIELKMAFNKLKSIGTGTFTHLHDLEHIRLNDNKIASIKKAAFSDLNSLRFINLVGNEIKGIEIEAFQNLPRIEIINLAYNKIENLNLEMLDQVGRLSSLKIIVDHNEIQNLSVYKEERSQMSISVREMHLSYNNISSIDDKYFDPIRTSLIILDLNFNGIENLTEFAIAGMHNLEILSMAYNNITEIEDNALHGLRQLQIFNVSHNDIYSLPESLFAEHKKLRIVDISHNKLQELQPKVFENTKLEYVHLANNELCFFPKDVLRKINKTLLYLDLSSNNITYLHKSDVKDLSNLRQIILADNSIHIIEDGMLGQLPQLISLDFSSNIFDMLSDKVFTNISTNLKTINLANTNLQFIPKLSSPQLHTLNISYNGIKNIKPNTLDSIKNVKELDISFNDLPVIHKNIWATLPELQILYLNGNPIKDIKNDSFTNMENLRELHLSDLEISHMDTNSFAPLTYIRKIKMDAYSNMDEISFAGIFSKNHGIKDIHLNVQDDILKKTLVKNIPKSLRTLTIEGSQLQGIDDAAFENISNEELILKIHNTNITWLSKAVFKNMKNVQNLTALFNKNHLQGVELHSFASNTKMPTKKLKMLDLTDNNLNCGCEIIWMLNWIQEYEYEQQCKEESCEDILRDLRETKCSSTKYASVIDVLKSDLYCPSCGWSTILLDSANFMKKWLLLHIATLLLFKNL